MKTVVAGFSNELLEQEIAKIYWSQFLVARAKFLVSGVWPVLGVRESGLLGVLWDEFDSRFVAGLIGSDSDWEPDDVV